MKRLSAAWLLFLLIFYAVSFFSVKPAAAAFTTPLEAPNYSVLLVEDDASSNFYARGWLASDLSTIGFNVTWVRNQTIDYTTDWRTADLSQYDIILLHGANTAGNPTLVTDAELYHFCAYDGILIVSAETLMRDSGGWRGFADSDTQVLEARLGVDYTGWANGDIGSYADNGTYSLTNASIDGLPDTITQSCSTYNLDWFTIKASLNGASQIYNFTDEESEATITGITYYKNATGAIGIWICSNIAYVKEVGDDKILFGMAHGYADDHTQQFKTERQAFLLSTLSYALERDYTTILKFQPLAIFRTDDFGSGTWTDAAQVSAFNNLHGNVSNYDARYSFAFMGAGGAARPLISALCVQYEHLYDSNIHINGASILGNSVTEGEAIIDDEEAYRQALGFKDLSLTSSCHGTTQEWDQNWLTALSNQGIPIWLLTESDLELGGRARDQWWEMNIDSGVLLHDTRYYRGSGTWLSAWLNFYNKRGEAAISATKHFADVHFGHVDEWRDNAPSNEDAGRKGLITVYGNFSYEIPDIQFTTLREATICSPTKYDGYFTGVSRTGNVISFNLNTDNVGSLATVGKGTAWIRVNTTSTIASVTVDGSAISSFDSNSFKIPAENCAVSVTLGTPGGDPRLVESEGAAVTISSFSDGVLSLRFVSRSGTLSTAQVYCASEGEPPGGVTGTDEWSYSAGTNTITMNVTYSSSQDVEIDWTEYAQTRRIVVDRGYIALAIASLGLIVAVGVAIIRMEWEAAFLAALLGSALLVALFVVMYILQALSQI